MWIASVSHAREVDRRSTVEFGLPTMVLMERAGAAVFEAVLQMLPEKGRLGVFCGKGNNGGDGFVFARLALQYGFEVECLVAASDCELTGECRQQMLQAKAQGVHPIFSNEPRWKGRLEQLGRFDLIVDGILGTGATRHVEGQVHEMITAINKSGVEVVSIDIPSGIHADTGEELGESIWAVKTITFGQPKPCFFQGIGLEHAGDWHVADIGFPRELIREPTEAFLLDKSWVQAMIPERLRGCHKGSNGHVLIVAGSHRMRGAAVLAAKSAYRTGAGLVTVASIESVCQAVLNQCPEAVILPLPEADGFISPDAAEVIRENSDQYEGAVFGPGMGQAQPVFDLLTELWKDWQVDCVIDADALNAVSKGVKLPPSDCLLTPHPGEMSRLLQTTVAEIQADRFQAVQTAMNLYRRSVLLKGPYSIVGASCEPLLVNPTGNPGMASAGMGDVLAGMAGALVAQDLPCYFAGGVAMYWHGLAGDLCAARIGPVGYVARDVCQTIPCARAKLQAECAEV